MLFGEYGVLVGGPAVAASIPQYSFSLDFCWNPAEGMPSTWRAAQPEVDIVVESPWFPTGTLNMVLSQNLAREEPGRTEAAGAARGASRDLRFFEGIFEPFREDFAVLGGTFSAKVVSGFSPQLGFGSSSALIAGFHRALAHLLEEKTGHKLSEVELWNRLKATLSLVQGGGSGYDAAVQRAAINSTQVKLWHFASEDAAPLPHVKELSAPRSGWGVLLATGIYADTAAALKRFRDTSDRKAFALAHADLARAFLARCWGKEDDERFLAELFQRSLSIARAQGLLEGGEAPATLALTALVQRLEQSGIPFKTMGAGRGDCLWLLASRRSLELCGLQHPITGEPLASSVVFEFKGKGEERLTDDR